MGYIFLKDGNAGVIKNSNGKTVLRTYDSPTIRENDQGGITIDLEEPFSCQLSDIVTIDGVKPNDLGDAIDKLFAVFPDAPAEAGANQVEIGTYAAQGNGAAGQVIIIPITKQGVTSAAAIPLNDNAVAAAIQSQQLNGQNLEVTIVAGENEQQLTYTYIAK